ncbi:autotransporter outer membrane beta-barrel domain-containing protein [Selenomonas massiliensis]|uniref:autotransporter outer membrane beta-barrel domain-containing protein n=1 Tax=Selenomonas massiliensis TaxID=2058293 RepID=UPI000D0F9D20|nr:autotransporter outer membrane beta-barrel domain-containing protein [Selenomonas massiliensis]
MYQEIKSRRLALLVAIALTGGSLAGATNAYAAEVTGQNVTINASTPPTNNATDPYGNTGSAAGAINDPANGDDVSGNTLTLANYDYSGKNIFGGFTRGTGRAKDNIVHIRSGGTVDSAVGGGTYGGGDVVGNRVYLHAGGLVDGVVGGYVDGASGSAEDNHVVVESGTVKNFIYGGNIGIASTGHVTGNTVKIAGGVIGAPVYGGYTNGSGHVTGNTVTITGGEIRDHVYGGFTNGDGDVKDNIVNIGDGAHDLAAGTRIQKSIYGGSNGGGSGTISGNILNVNASASAQNIHNFDTINFSFTNTLSPKLTLSDTAGTTIKSLSDITVNGFSTIGTSTLIENVNGITVSDGTLSVTTTGDTAETILSTDTTGQKIDYARYIFKGARTAESSIYNETWGGRSVIGNTTTGNEITVTSGTHTDVYGGWTREASSQTATADKGNSTYNKVTVDGTATVSGNVYGGMTTVMDGKASNNEVTINGGTLNGIGDVYGGSANSGSSVDNNKVYLNGISTPGTVYGGSAGLGTANGNEVHLNGATVGGTVFGGAGPTSTSKNKVYLNGAQVTGDVYGGNATSANDNEVHLNGATVTGGVSGGAADGTGNLLSVKGVNSAGQIACFQKVSFDTAGVAAGATMLTITNTANRTALDWNALTATGTARGIDLIYHEQGIDLSHYTAGSVKSALSADGKSEYDIEAVEAGGTVKRIAYNSYQFKDARTAETVGGETWGGRSRVGNTTTGNEITVSSGTHTEVYGGWTRGASSQTATADKGNSTYNKVTVDGTATVSGNVYGGMTTVAGGKASNNVVTINEGVTLNDSRYVYGGSATSGSSVDNNKVYLNGIRTSGTVYGGSTGFGTANGNEVHLNGATVRGAVFGGEGASASKNKVYLLNDAQVTGDVYGGNATSANDNEVHLNGATVTGAVIGGAIDGTGNLLSVKGVNSARWIAGFQEVSFDTAGVAAGETMLNLNGSAGTTLDRGAIDATGDTVSGGISLLHNANGITVNGLAATDNILKSEADETTEKNIAAHRTGGNITDIRYEGYQFAGVTTPVVSGTDAYGGISRAGNSTHNNVITVNGNYANVYGGHTSGAGTTRADKDNSYSNTVTITGGTLGNVYGGYTAAADGTTNNNTVTLAGGTVTGTVSGGNRTADGNTLNVVGMNNRAGSVENFQNMNFDATGAVKNSTLLTVTGANATKVDWTKVSATGTSVKPLTLLKNESGIDLTGYTGAAKSETTDTAETNVDVRKNSLGRITAITYEGYQFARAESASVIGADAYGGISRAGNATHTNHITVNGNYTNVYGGHTSGMSTTAVEKKNSHDNTVTITGGTLGNVYGGYTAAADGTTNNNTVTLAGGTVTGTVSGGNRTAQGNKLVVNTNARVGKIENFEKYVFNYKESMTANPMLTLTGGAASMRLDAIEANGTVTETPTTLVHNAAGLTIADYDNKPKSMLNADGTRETNLDVRKTGTLLTDIVRYSSYSLKGTTESTTSGGNTWGGRSSAGNTTAENSVAITGGNHTDIYGGWTTGTGSQAAADKRGDSISNKVTVNGSAAVSGTVYGGFTDVANGKATRNEVAVEKAIAGSVVGGQSAGDAKGNIVNIKADSGAITGGKSAGGEATGNSVTVGNGTVSGNIVGGDGTTTNKNIVSLAQANVTGSITGGSGTTANENTVNIDRTNVAGTITGGAADGTGNTLNVAGTNIAANIGGFQKVNFDAAGAVKNSTLLTITGGAQTKVNWTNLTATGTAEKPLTLLKNESGIDLVGYTGAAKSETTDTAETNVDVRKNNDGKVTEITYEGYQFARAESASVIGTDAYGGISKAGNATHTNHITVNSDYTNVYGGHTSGAGTTKDDKDNSYSNSVTITGGKIGNVYGGYTAAADGTTNNNTVTLAGGTVTGTVSGGNRTADGNRLNVDAAARVGRVENFEKVAFKDAASKLTLTDTGTFNLDTLATNFDATANPVTLVESANALTLAGGKAFKSELNADGTQETDLDVRGGKKIVRYAYTFAGAKAATTVGADTWGGRSAAGNTTTNNEITLADGSYTNVYGGRTTGAGSQAATDKRGDSISNKVTVNGTAAVSGIVYGGYTDVTGGRATGNEVTIEKATVGSVVGGYGTTASGNAINLTDATVSGSVTGGRGTITNDNIIRLRNTKVTGTVTGGSGTITNENRTGFRSVTVSSTAASGTGNTLAVYYGTGTTSIGDLGGIQNIHFDLEDAPTDGTAHTLLSLTNAAGEKNLSDIHLVVHRSGATKKLRKGDTFTLVENKTAGGSVSIGDNVTAEGTDGVTRNYTFGIARNADGKLVATVTKAGMNGQAKSLVETRAGASAFLNDGADFLAGAGMSAAQKEAAAAAMTSGGVYGLWAGMGAGSLRHKTGSYVDMKGWNLGVGWARENAVKAGTLTFGPFIEYGRGSYDSYLDDGTHGSGKTSYVGVGMMAKLETKANSWIDGALRVGRTKSDYTGLDTSYDTTSTYYAMHVGVGKDFRVREGDTVSAYVRYSYAHTAGASAHLSSGETCDFDAVNSHRLRIGTRYTHGETALSQLYAGLAWEYEFGGDARATYDGDSAPSPSLRGGSGLLELGYRFAPKADSRISYDLNLSGWQGKRQGVTGGISVKWAF